MISISFLILKKTNIKATGLRMSNPPDCFPQPNTLAFAPALAVFKTIQGESGLPQRKLKVVNRPQVIVNTVTVPVHAAGC